MTVAERLRWIEGEKDGWTGKERVALGGISRGGTSMFWVELTNVHASPEHNFAADGEEVHEALQVLRLERASAHVLWHSHEKAEEPSAMDIRSFPTWLSVGVVWSAASATSTSYDRNGIISSTRSTVLPDDSVLQAANELAKAGLLRDSAAHAAAVRAVNDFELVTPHGT